MNLEGLGVSVRCYNLRVTVRVSVVLAALSVWLVLKTAGVRLHVRRANVRGKAGIGSELRFGLGVAALPGMETPRDNKSQNTNHCNS